MQKNVYLVKIYDLYVENVVHVLAIINRFRQDHYLISK